MSHRNDRALMVFERFGSGMCGTNSSRQYEQALKGRSYKHRLRKGGGGDSTERAGGW